MPLIDFARTSALAGLLAALAVPIAAASEVDLRARYLPGGAWFDVADEGLAIRLTGRPAANGVVDFDGQASGVLAFEARPLSTQRPPHGYALLGRSLSARVSRFGAGFLLEGQAGGRPLALTLERLGPQDYRVIGRDGTRLQARITASLAVVSGRFEPEKMSREGLAVLGAALALTFSEEGRDISGAGSDADADAPPAGDIAPLAPPPSAAGLDLGSLFDGASVSLSNGRLRRFTLEDKPKNLEFELGDLGAGALSPSLGPSPYWSVTKGRAGSGGWLDYEVRGQAAQVELAARSYLEVPAPGLQGGFGRESYLMLSGLAQMGRAYHLYGPVDAAWSALGVVRRSHVFPNVSFDESAGLRLRLGEDSSLALFGGVTQAVGLLSTDWAARATAGLSQQAGLENAPHRALSLWGRLPWRRAEYSVELGRQDNPMTEVSSVHAALGAPAGAGRVSVYGARETETGARIEFDRRRSSLGASWAPDERTRWYVEYGRQDFRFGDAEARSRQVTAGLEVVDKARGGARSGVESSFGGRETIASDDVEFRALAGSLTAGLSQLEATLNQAVGLLEATDEDQAWLAFAAYYGSLPADTRAALEAELGPPGRDGFDLPAWISTLRQGGAGAARARALVADPALLDRAFTRYARTALQKGLGETELKVLGGQVRLTPPALVALLHAYSLGVSPLPPAGRDLLSGPLDPRLLDEINRKFGSACSGSFQTVSACLVEHMPADQRAALEAAYGQDLPVVLGDSMALLAQVLRRELNQFLLSALLAAEKLDALSVDRGRRLADLNQDALKRSFFLLDRRRGGEGASARVLTRAEARLRAELSRQEVEIARRLREHGPVLLGRLVSEPSWPANVSVSIPPGHWPALLSEYGSAPVAGFLRRAAARLGEKAGPRLVRLRLEYKDDPDLGLSLTHGESIRLTLPAVGPGHDPASTLDAALSVL